MTTSNVTARTSAVGTNSIGQVVSFSFPVLATSDLVVKTRVTATGVEVALAETTDYTVAIVSGVEGGSITTVAAIAATLEIHVIRSTPKTQALDLAAGGSFGAETVEASLDKAHRLIIDLQDTVSRCLVIPDTDDGTLTLSLPDSIDRASSYLYFDSSGNVSSSTSAIPATATVTAFAETILDDANAGAVRTTLGLVIGTDVQAWDTQLDDLAALAVTDGNFIVGDGAVWVAESGATALTSLGVTAFAQTILDDATAAAALVTLGTSAINDILTYEGAVLTYEGDVLTWAA